MKATTTVMVKLSVDGMHNFPAAAELFPEVAFLADRHRHMFHFKVAKKVYHDDRDIEFIMFKKDVLDYLRKQYFIQETRTHEFGPSSCEMLAKEILSHFDCEWVEVWEDDENGARVDRL